MSKKITGRLIRTLLLKHGHTQNEMASLLNIPQPRISEYMRGLRKMPVAVLFKLRDAYGLTWQQLGDLGEPKR